MKLILTVIQGFCMALADSVPGVSGGTIAFILGFYDKFILSLNHLMSGNKKEWKEAAAFLGKLFLGWLLGFAGSVLILGNIFHTHIYELCSLFLGLSLFALPIIINEEHRTLRGKYKYLVFTLLGIGAVSLLTFLNGRNGAGGGVDLSELSIRNILYVFITAMVAISAMVLPGISGSTLLLIFGLYVPIIGAIKEMLHFNFVHVPILFVFGLGVLIGITTVVRLVKICLLKFRAQTIYLILGLVIGSFYAIVMGPSTLDIPQEPMTFSTFHPIYFLSGALILFGLQKLKSVSAK